MSRHARDHSWEIGLVHGPDPDGQTYRGLMGVVTVDHKLTQQVSANWAAGVVSPRHDRADDHGYGHPAQDPEAKIGMVYLGDAGWFCRLAEKISADGWLAFRYGELLRPREPNLHYTRRVRR